MSELLHQVKIRFFGLYYENQTAAYYFSILNHFPGFCSKTKGHIRHVGNETDGYDFFKTAW